MNSKKFDYTLDDGNTWCYVLATTNDQGSTAYVLTEHPDNQGKPVHNQASEVGDRLIGAELANDSSYKPESLRLYAERPELGEDGSPRFAEYDAHLTKQENISTNDNEYVFKADEWRWSDGNRMDRSELENVLGTEIETGPLRFQDKSPMEQNKEFAEAQMPTGFREQSNEPPQSSHQEQPQPAPPVQENEQDRDR